MAPRPATPTELHRVHAPTYLAHLERICDSGGAQLDPDTAVSAGSWETALSAAGAGLDAIERLDAGQGLAALALVRPPGHHAGAETAMGFCLLNNLAVAAAALLARGDRVVVVDWDVHHGNGTQDLFWQEPGLLYISVHEAGLYPGTGSAAESGGELAEGTTLNIPLPPGTAGGAIRRATELLIAPAIRRFAPDWLLVSAGFDGHRADPLANWLLTAGDYGALTRSVVELATAGRLIVFLEGGYDPSALRNSVGAVSSALAGGSYLPEPVSDGDVGLHEVESIVTWRQRQPWYG